MQVPFLEEHPFSPQSPGRPTVAMTMQWEQGPQRGMPGCYCRAGDGPPGPPVYNPGHLEVHPSALLDSNMLPN